MPLREEFEIQGNWLFVRRSWLPLLFFPLLIIALFSYDFVNTHFGSTCFLIFQLLCLLISFLGLIVRAIAIGYAPAGTSGRNTTEGQIAEQLNTSGIYSIVRHPLYLGNFLIFLGFTLFTQSLWLNILSCLAYWIYYERIMYAEEEFLRRKYGQVYESWASVTPAFIPRFSKWITPPLSFSLKNVLKREYTAFFEITLAFPVLDLLGRYFTQGKFTWNYFWIGFFLLGLIIYITLRTLKKKTHLLDVEGR